MQSILLAALMGVLYLVAYHTYGKFIARKLFGLCGKARTPAEQINDGTDYVPTKREILFGHHYTSIAGTGPIVGPALGIIWGWVPALIWVIFGSIFMGAVHDFTALAISIRNQGRGIGDIAGDVISKRVRIMFLCIISLTLLIVIAIFCLVIAVLFNMYPQSVLSVWIEIPIAVALGYLVYKKGKPALPLSLIGLVLLYVAIYIACEFPAFQIKFQALSIPGLDITLGPIVLWSLLLLVYVFFASVLPVTTLLQPRDYINGHELFVVMILLALGVGFSRPEIVAPMVNLSPKGAPPMLPFLFITIACGAISGFHSLVSSGTTSKQLHRETDALPIGYGGMLMEGMLAVFVLIAVSGGIALVADGSGQAGIEAWTARYSSWTAAKGLPAKVDAFVTGSAKMLFALGIPLAFGKAVMGVFVASFAGTTIDSATRLQRYVVSELGRGIRFKPLTNKYVAAAVAVISAGALALWDGQGKGGLVLWPLFGATNQLLAALALLVVTVYLARKGKPIAFTLIPFLLMLALTGWAMVFNLTNFWTNYFSNGKDLHLLIIAAIIVLLEVWMIVEAAVVLIKSRREPPSTTDQPSLDAQRTESEDKPEEALSGAGQ